MDPSLIMLIGGTALLVFSVDELSKHIQILASSRLRVWINTFAGNRLYAMILGVLMSLLLSSSSAVTVILVGLANAQLLTLEQVFSVSLGAAIGSTLIVQLVAFNVAEYGLIIMAAGVALSTFSKVDRSYHLGRIFVNIGFMFFSMSLMVESGKALENNDLFKYFINYFQDRPLVSFFIAASLTALFRSSAATIAFVMSLTMARHGNIYTAIPWVLGANLGTTTTAYFASLNGGILGKQAALGNLLLKLVGVILFIPLAGQLGKWCIELAPDDVSRQIAHSHTLFNVIISIVFFPFITWGVKVVRKLAGEKLQETPFSFHYLDARSLDAPELALAQAHREILRMSDIVEKMVDRSLGLFRSQSQAEHDAVKEMDQIVDFLNKGVKLYLTKLSQAEMTPEQVQKEFEFLLRTNDLENIGDIVDRNLLSLVKKIQKKGSVFSKEGWEELNTFHRQVVECVRLSTAYFNTRDRTILSKLLLHHQRLRDLMVELSEQHVQRLHRGVKETLDTTSVHLDVLSHLQRIADLSVGFTRVNIIKPENEVLNP